MSGQESQERGRSSSLAGCCGFGSNRRNYFRRLRVVEVQETFFMPPQKKTLARWRADAPDSFVFVIKAWQLITHEADAKRGYPRLARDFQVDTRRCGRFELSDEVRMAYQRTVDAAETLGASAILFETPSSFTPTVDNRRRIASFFEEIDRCGRSMVWAPCGVWSQDEVAQISADLKLLPCADPFSADPPTAPRVYLRLIGGRYSEETLYRLADRLADVETAYCLFNSINMFRDSQRLQAFFDQLPEGDQPARDG